MEKIKITILFLLLFLSFVTQISFAKSIRHLDKAAHVAVSFGMTAISYNIVKKITDFSDTQAKIAAVLLSMTVGTAKEFYDMNSKSKEKPFNYKDLTANGVGTGLGLIYINIEF